MRPPPGRAGAAARARRARTLLRGTPGVVYCSQTRRPRTRRSVVARSEGCWRSTGTRTLTRVRGSDRGRKAHALCTFGSAKSLVLNLGAKQPEPESSAASRENLRDSAHRAMSRNKAQPASGRTPQPASARIAQRLLTTISFLDGALTLNTNQSVHVLIESAKKEVQKAVKEVPTTPRHEASNAPIEMGASASSSFPLT